MIVQTVGGPIRTWQVPNDAPAGHRFVCWLDGWGQPMRPVVYELIAEPHPRLGRIARYVGQATEDDLFEFAETLPPSALDVAHAELKANL